MNRNINIERAIFKQRFKKRVKPVYESVFLFPLQLGFL